MIVCLETATNLCSVALCDSDGVISLRESTDTKSHASLLSVFIDEILKENGLKTKNLEAIAVSKGPGSYTGLRIGVSVAKGIAYASLIPLIGIETTLSMFMGMKERSVTSALNPNDLLFCPMLDARRMEVYYALYDSFGNCVKQISAEVINEDSFKEISESQSILLFGDGAEKCREIIRRKNILFDPDFKISASHMLIPAYQAFRSGDFEDIAYFEPFYLKDFITSKPRKNILG
jgi:tRNA threonylcarbamoyladenosine biosynthesis protein TsaB